MTRGTVSDAAKISVQGLDMAYGDVVIQRGLDFDVRRGEIFIIMGGSGTGKSTFYRDADSDTFGSSSSTLSRCDLPSGYVVNNTDCNDASGSINPGATEVCDGGASVNTDENCNGTADNADSGTSNFTSFYTDADQDGYGTTPMVQACESYAGVSATSGDYSSSRRLSTTTTPNAARQRRRQWSKSAPECARSSRRFAI